MTALANSTQFGTLQAEAAPNNFYLFDEEKNMVLAIALYDQFTTTYEHNNHLFVVTKSGIFCVDSSGVLIWRNTFLGLDQVVIDSFDDEFVFGRGQWAPPDDMRSFRLSRLTGLEV